MNKLIIIVIAEVEDAHDDIETEEFVQADMAETSTPIDLWSEEEVISAYEKLKADPARAISGRELDCRMAARREARRTADRILSEKRDGSERQRFIEVLMAIPDVGEGSDFERIQ
ncbi:protein of unknown function [Pararobbsia alpina]|uniref:hypothetical protein n=1 Tax=Pararobbsia alpina TaxID=621374 RepID=UPI0039A5256E